jgi:hypothetical protein
MRKLILSIGIMLIGLALHAQSMDCPSTLALRKASPPYAYNELSKSLQCTTGKKYEYELSLKPGKEYRISFYASSNLGNRMQFQIIDTKTAKKLMDLPGTTAENKKGECALVEYFDYATEKLVHPYFDFVPTETLNLKINIDLPEYTYKLKISDGDPNLGTEDKYEEITEVRKGCVTVFIQDIISEELGNN